MSTVQPMVLLTEPVLSRVLFCINCSMNSSSSPTSKTYCTHKDRVCLYTQNIHIAHTHTHTNKCQHVNQTRLLLHCENHTHSKKEKVSTFSNFSFCIIPFDKSATDFLYRRMPMYHRPTIKSYSPASLLMFSDTKYGPVQTWLTESSEVLHRHRGRLQNSLSLLN